MSNTIDIPGLHLITTARANTQRTLAFYIQEAK